MSAYQQALENSGTTMVLSPDSEFFRFFRDPGGVPSPAAPTEAPPAPGASAPGDVTAPGTAGSATAEEAPAQ